MSTLAAQKITQNALRKLQDGKFDAAVKLARAGLKKHPKAQDLLKILANAATESGQHVIAAKAYADLNRLDPGQKEIRMGFGIALVHAGKGAAALQRATEWAELDPQEADYAYLQAVAATSLADFNAARDHATRALEQKPKMVDAWSMRGLAHFDLKAFEEALADFQQAETLDPLNAQIVLNIGLCQRTLHQTDAAIETLKRCLELAPHDQTARTNLAGALEQSGALAEARDVYETIRQKDPANWTVIHRLVELNTPAQNEALAPALEPLIRKVRAKSDAEVDAHMAYAELQARLGAWDTAMVHYAQSNRAYAKVRPYDPARAEDQFARTLALFPAGHTPRLGGGSDGARPLFVIGQPRSGTTLTEMMISAHCDVVGLGEFGAIEDVALAALYTRQSDPAAHRAAYLKEMPTEAAGAVAFVDKMPANYRFVGFLAEAFPSARFVHITRDPREVAISMWRRHFSGDFMRYASDFKWMAHAANLYQHYIRHWHSLYRDRILDISYQELVEGPDAASRKLAAFCDLEWQARMAAPEKNTGLVQTASVVQVRQKVHQRSLRSWERHGDLIAPFVAALDPALWPELQD